jgi:hypothetical protein
MAASAAIMKISRATRPASIYRCYVAGLAGTGQRFCERGTRGAAISDSRQRPEPLATLATAWPANSSVNVDRRPAPDPQGSASAPVRFTIARCREPTEIEADVLAENAHPGGRIFVAVGLCYRPDRVYRGSYPLEVAPAGKLDGDDLSSSTSPRPARHMSMRAAVVTEFAGQLCR